MSLFWELPIRFGSIGMLVCLSLVFANAGMASIQARFALLLNLTMLCLLLIAGTPPWVPQGALLVVTSFLSTLVFPAAWLFGLSLFIDKFRISRIVLAVLAIYFIPPVFFAAFLLGFESPWADALRWCWLAMSLGLMIHLAYCAIAGRAEDLVERRRKERVRVATAISVLLLVIASVSELIAAFGEADDWRYLLLLAIPYSIGMATWTLRARPEAFAFEPRPREVEPALSIDPRDRHLKSALDKLMEEQKIYRTQGIAIGTLAQHLDVPEHQLRALINKSMGHRNFASFLNQYRIREAIEHLSDPAKSRVQIITIAMDVGFSSLTPFNGAFKDATGMTPREFRQRALADADVG